MKTIAHAWVGLMALERLKSLSQSKSIKKSYLGQNFKKFFLGNTFNPYFNEQSARFVKFFDKHQDAFVQGAWFPDSVIVDNLSGGHTFKFKKPTTKREMKKAGKVKNRVPKHLSSQTLVSKKSRFNETVYQKFKYTLPDRCEALSHAIRDMILIQRKESKGSEILFNDDQITLYFLMLSHYLADAHVPPHCDNRDFYGPPTIHPDMEAYWDDEIKRFYSFDKKRKVFDYDRDGAPELNKGMEKEFKKSFLYEVLKELDKRRWKPSDKKILGKTNKKIYDYAKAVCFVSYLLSTDFIPELSKKEYKKIKIRKNQS